MEFTGETLEAMRSYVRDNCLLDCVEVGPGEARMFSEDAGRRFLATVRPGDGAGFSVTVEDRNPSEAELGFSYGLPFTVGLDGTWEARETLCYARAMLGDCVGLATRLRDFVEAARLLSCNVYELNRGYRQLGVPAVDCVGELAKVAARAAGPRKGVVVEVRDVPGESGGRGKNF